jgi:TonB family protein
VDIFTIANLLPYTFQVCCLAALATLLAAVVRIDSAAVRHTYWRLVLAASVAWPFMQPVGSGRAAVDSAAATSAAVAATLAATGSAAKVTMPFDWTPVILTILIAGVCARLIRVAAGAISLRRLRGFGAPAIDVPHIDALQQTLGTHADVRVVPGLAQPATFGVLRPVVLLPGSLREQPCDIQRALVAHELIHVKRRDWLWVLGEELLLAVCWFNPAMWWIVSELRRSREEAVDELAVLVTGSRRTYAKALLAFAGDATLAPAPAFAERRHLVRRITLLTTEAVMSSTRIVLSCAVMAIVLVVGGWYTAAAFPLVSEGNLAQAQGPGPLERRATVASPQNPPPKRTDYEAPEYPAEARAVGASGIINLRIALDEVGRVGEARRTSFSLTTTNPAVSFSLDNSSPEAFEAFANKAVLRDKDGNVADNRMLLRIADALTDSAIRAVQNWRYEPPANGPVAFDIRVHFSMDGEISTASNVPRVGMPKVSTIDSAGALRVGGNIKAPIKIKDVRPVYPPAAQQARVQGMVIVEARIGVDGSVETVQVLRSIPLLDEAAIEAVRQWKFTPTLLNGAPVPVMMTMTVNFTLQ